MYVGIRDVCLFRAGYGNIAQAMDELSLVDIELVEQFASHTRYVHCKNIDYPSRHRERRRSLRQQVEYLAELVADFVPRLYY